MKPSVQFPQAFQAWNQTARPQQRHPIVRIVLTIAIVCWGSAPSHSQERKKPLEGGLVPFLRSQELKIRSLFENERFPNIVVSLAGTVIATWGKEKVRVRRSEDGGNTWGAEIIVGPGLQGGGTTVDEISGDILVFVEERHPP